jgi:hypothetical protein
MSGLMGWCQGNVNLTKISQRRQDLQQNGLNFVTGAADGTANNSIRSQGFAVGNVISFWR